MGWIDPVHKFSHGADAFLHFGLGPFHILIIAGIVATLPKDPMLYRVLHKVWKIVRHHNSLRLRSANALGTSFPQARVWIQLGRKIKLGA
jgi:hypothetical protein